MIRAKDKGLALCRTCRTLTDHPGERCIVCGTPTSLRDPFSLQRVWAFWIAGVIAYIPGNLLPIMITKTVAEDSGSTIMGGVITLVHYESYAIAAVIFLASVVVPVSKFVVIAWLALSIQRRWNISQHQQHLAHELVEFIGRWSMVDVFVVAALAALIQIKGLIEILPGPGVDAFAISVILTMMSAMSLDPRLIWDLDLDERGDEQGETIRVP
ncbi:MAG: paraquat-inducible protein A [Alphaproteobacteria bacterium]